MRCSRDAARRLPLRLLLSRQMDLPQRRKIGLGDGKFADIILVIKEAPATHNGESREVWRGPAHRHVLYEGSEMLAAQIDRWSDGAADASSSSSSMPPLKLSVEPGEGPAALLLLDTMYVGADALRSRNPTQVEIITALRLADSWHAPASARMLGDSLISIPPASFEWATAVALFSPPDCIRHSPYFVGATLAATRKVCTELGDLDAAWIVPERRETLLALPAPALYALLQNPGTRVSTEEVALLTVSAWFESQKAAGGSSGGNSGSGGNDGDSGGSDHSGSSGCCTVATADVAGLGAATAAGLLWEFARASGRGSSSRCLVSSRGWRLRRVAAPTSSSKHRSGSSTTSNRSHQARRLPPTPGGRQAASSRRLSCSLPCASAGWPPPASQAWPPTLSGSSAWRTPGTL